MYLDWDFINKYFEDNKSVLVSHHLDSYNDFFDNGLKSVFKEKNPITILKQQDPDTKEFRLKCELFLGGVNGEKIYYGKPIIYDDKSVHYMYPNEARLRNMNYGFSIHFDVDVIFTIIPVDGEETVHKMTLDKIFLGRFPVMLMSNLCFLEKLHKKARFEMGECKNDPGGYFIIDGKEKVIVCQEKFADNMLIVKDKVNELYSHACEIRSVSEDSSKPIRTTSVRMVSPQPSITNKQIVVNIPNVRKPIPLFIVFRALGIISDKEIIKFCLLDLEKNSNYMELFIPSIHDANRIFEQSVALKYIATFTKGKTVPHVLDILMNYFLPHIGEKNFRDKALFLGHMVFKMLKVYTKEENPTDRDSFSYKRVETTGALMYDLFKEYYTIMLRNIYKKIDKEYYYHEGQYQDMKFIQLIENNYREFFKERDVEVGFRKAFKGNWGAESHTKKSGIVQDLNRLSFNSALAQRRKLNLPMDASAKIVKPRLLHGSQWGVIDPLDTPDGGNVGLHKHLAISTKITNGFSREPIINWLRNVGYMKALSECSVDFLATYTKIFVNGSWVGSIENPSELIQLIRFYKRSALLPIYMTSTWNISSNTILIYTDAGRLIRPIYYIEGPKESKIISRDRSSVADILTTGNYTWNQLVTGFLEKKDKQFKPDNNKIYKIEELYGRGVSSDILMKNKAIIDYMDSTEANDSFISVRGEKIEKNRFTHVEIHPSLLLGIMGNQIIFPENNQLPRDLFSCGQSKQGVSLYHSNYQNRIDKLGVVLSYGQIPLIKSRYFKYINNEEHPYGENVIVAIMCYNGYNVEDSILFNKASVERGMFRTSYYNMYEAHEESSKVAGSMVDTKFINVEKENVIGLKAGVDYSYLDEHGLVREGTELNDKTAIIGKGVVNLDNPDTLIDSSVYPKKGQLGVVDKTFITEGDEGFRLAKVRIREERIPAIGDKFCSRCGQKGTIGLVIPEENMPFTADGIRPDIIVNPHAFPSRMTIGQLVEMLTGKVSVNYGAYGDCTAFVNNGPKVDDFGEHLTRLGFNKTGCELLYNGMTGEQMETEIFIGPTYYMRLKHMVKDKINYRAQGPRTMMTRQTVQGRANDGGLRVGEMERDGLLGHGASAFIKESMMVRGDDFYVAICNKTGTVAIYNEDKNLFLSPMADGPIKFVENVQGDLNIENISRFGRSFSVIRVPYAFKLLMQELLTMNVQMRIITEDNVNQLLPLSFSDNINTLLNKKVDIKDLREASQAKVEKEKEEVPGPKTPEEPGREQRPKGPGYGITFVVGDVAAYNSDSITNRKWNIKEDMGNTVVITTYDSLESIPRFGKLERDDLGEFISIVVNKEELTKYIDPMYGSPYIPTSGPQTPPEPMSPAYNPTFGPQTPPEPMSPAYNPTFGPQTPPEPMSPEYNPTFGPQTPPGTPPPMMGPQTPQGTPPPMMGPQTPPPGTPPPPGFVPVQRSPSPEPQTYGPPVERVRTPSPSYGPGSTFREGSPDYGPNTTYFDDRRARFEETNEPYPPMGMGPGENVSQEDKPESDSILDVKEEKVEDKKEGEEVKKKITLDI